ncbi:hypothetical protein VPH35_052085 [Triticum aestivum]
MDPGTTARPHTGGDESDLHRHAREWPDQFVHDLHPSGRPSPASSSDRGRPHRRHELQSRGATNSTPKS